MDFGGPKNQIMAKHVLKEPLETTDYIGGKSLIFKISLPSREVFYYWRVLPSVGVLWFGGFLLYLNFNQSSGSF